MKKFKVILELLFCDRYFVFTGDKTGGYGFSESMTVADAEAISDHMLEASAEVMQETANIDPKTP